MLSNTFDIARMMELDILENIESLGGAISYKMEHTWFVLMLICEFNDDWKKEGTKIVANQRTY